MSESFMIPIDFRLKSEADFWRLAQAAFDAVDVALGGGTGSNDLDASTADHRTFRRPTVAEVEAEFAAQRLTPNNISWQQTGDRKRDPRAVIISLNEWTVGEFRLSAMVFGDTRIPTEHGATKLVEALEADPRLKPVLISVNRQEVKITSRDDGKPAPAPTPTATLPSPSTSTSVATTSKKPRTGVGRILNHPWVITIVGGLVVIVLGTWIVAAIWGPQLAATTTP